MYAQQFFHYSRRIFNSHLTIIETSKLTLNTFTAPSISIKNVPARENNEKFSEIFRSLDSEKDYNEIRIKG